MEVSRKERIIEQISRQAGISKEEIHERVKRYIADLDGLLSEDGALAFLIRDLNVNIEPEPESQTSGRTTVAELRPDMPVISLVGKIINIFSVRTFTRKDGSLGKVVNLILSDGTGQIRIALWDKDAERVENGEITIGTVLEIQYAYVKEGYQGQLEIALGRNGKIKVNPEGVDPSSFPEPAVEFISIKDLKPGMSSASVRGRIVSEINPRIVMTKDGREVQILKLIVADKTGSIEVPIWENQFSRFKTMKKGDKIEILNGYTVEGFRETLELRIGNSTEIRINPSKGTFPKLNQLKLEAVGIQTSSKNRK
ncbi:MAG: OB-fold nucleic acid binding domain-containing protein, partial [Candidatus Helarchaeales archaeon]